MFKNTPFNISSKSVEIIKDYNSLETQNNS
jgi:hypothetical protein